MMGKAFRAADGEEYGLLRPAEAPYIAEVRDIAFAADGCGNYFVLGQGGCVQFWDHESGEFTELASSWSLFVSALYVPKPIELKPGQVKHVWVDPEFAAQHWLKKKMQ